MPAGRNTLGYFLMVATGVFLSTMDSSMVNIALPYIMESFSTTLSQVEWVVLVYLLTIAVSLLIWGKLSDHVGKGIVYLSGMLIFSSGSLLCSISPTLAVLVLFRFVQGLGASMMMATGPAIIRGVVPHRQLGSWLGALGIATSLGLLSGPLVGGFVLHSFNWRTLFLFNAPVSFIVFLFGWFFLAGTLPKHTGPVLDFDWKGAILWAVGVVMLVLLTNLQLLTSIYGYGYIIVCAVFGIWAFLFLRCQRRSENPLVPVFLLKQKYYFIAMIAVLISFCVLFFVLILMPFFFKYVMGLSSDRIGYMMMAVPVTLFVVSPLAGRMFDRFGARFLTSGGMLITTGAVLLLASITETSSLIDIGWRLALLGCGQSVFLSPNTASVLSRVEFDETGVSAGMLATSRNLGMLLGVSLVGLIFSWLYGNATGGDLGDFRPELLPQFLGAFRYSLYAAAFLAFTGSLISLIRK